MEKAFVYFKGWLAGWIGDAIEEVFEEAQKKGLLSRYGFVRGMR